MSNVVTYPTPSSSPRLGRYRLLATLGQGGMGTIHLAVAGGLGGFRKLFVVKELKEELAHNDEFLRLFMLEARLAARLNHANVVHTIEADQEDGRYFLAMEFLDGQPLSDILRRARQAPEVPLEVRLHVICQALAGLHHAHEIRDYDGRALNVVHRDVSPTNIFVTYDGQVKVLDFGIAKAGDAEGTQPRAFKGKIGYAAPEQLRMRASDRRADVFAAGVVLWEAIALRHMVRGKLTPQVFEARMVGTEPRIAQVVTDIDPALAQICDRAMSVDVEQRYPSAEAFRLELQDYLAERKLIIDATVIAQLMRVKFPEQRRTLHRMIEEQLRDEDTGTGAFLATRSPLLVPPERHTGLTEAEQRLLVEARASARPMPEPAEKKSTTLRWFVSAALLAALAWAWRIRSNDEAEQAGRPAPASASAEESVPLAPVPSELPGAPAALPTMPVADAPASAQADLAPPDAPTRVSPSKSGLNPRSSAREPHAARGATREPYQDANAEDPLSTLQTPASPMPARQERKPPGMDVDLRRVRPSTRRSLDMENPFRR